MKNIVTNKKYLIYGFLSYCIIGIAFISCIIHYINTLKSCKCYQVENKFNYSNTTYLIIIESFILAGYIITTLITLILISLMNKISFTNKIKTGNNNLTSSYIAYLISLIIIGYFIYYVYKLSQNVNEDCECTQSWLRYLLYIQVAYMFIGLIMNTLMLSMGKNIYDYIQIV